MKQFPYARVGVILKALIYLINNLTKTLNDHHLLRWTESATKHTRPDHIRFLMTYLL